LIVSPVILKKTAYLAISFPPYQPS
jgi:hypothetical protein